MAEKATMGHAMVFMLSYRNDENGEKPDGAKAFRYKHIQDFLKTVRKLYNDRYGKTGEITYIVVGERGSARDRVHWHIILFSKRPLYKLGKWAKFVGAVMPDYVKNKINAPIYDKNQFWSLWPHGLVHVQEPDQGGVAYVMKYALKDQFNEVKSRGTARFTKSEQHAASMFRMSKKPPIGARWLEEQVKSWRERYVVPPKLEMKVPDMKGYWWPRGLLREWLLGVLYRINEERKAKHGKECPQWQTLLASVSQDEESKDYETLTYGPLTLEVIEDGQIERYTKRQIQQEAANAERKSELLARYARTAAIRSRCGRAKVCPRCWRSFDSYQKAAATIAYEQLIAKRNSEQPGVDLDQYAAASRRGNPHCLIKHGPEYRDAFGA